MRASIKAMLVQQALHLACCQHRVHPRHRRACTAGSYQADTILLEVLPAAGLTTDTSRRAAYAASADRCWQCLAPSNARRVLIHAQHVLNLQGLAARWNAGKV